MKAAEWIDRVKAAKGLTSDYGAAKELGLSRALVSKYRGPTSTFDEETAIKIAHALNIDPAIILADQAMERAKNDEARSAWSAILERLGGVAAGLLIAVGASAPSPAPAAQAKAGDPGMYIMLSRRRRKKKAADALSWLPFPRSMLPA